jgi:MYXO-CTERM domain-containing protein
MDIRPVDDDDVIDLTQLPPNLTLRIQTDPPVVGSVSFHIDGAFIRTESIAPYSISSDDGRGNFAPWDLTVGAHTVRATPYSAANAAGREGEPLELDFTIVRGGVSGSDAGDAASSVGADSGADLTDGGAMDASVSVEKDAGRKPDARAVEVDDEPVEAERERKGGGCSVDEAGAGTAGARHAWMTLLALGMFAFRRSVRRSPR